MKRIFLLIILFSYVTIYGQKLNVSDSLILANIKLSDNLGKTNDSLKKELLLYQVKEDYYAAALSDQSTRFSLIVASIVGLFALISFSNFKREVRKLKSKYAVEVGIIRDELKNFEIRELEHMCSFCVVQGNIWL